MTTEPVESRRNDVLETWWDMRLARPVYSLLCLTLFFLSTLRKKLVFAATMFSCGLKTCTFLSVDTVGYTRIACYSEEFSKPF